MRKRLFATLKELRLLCEQRTATQPFQGCAVVKRCASSQGFKANPGLELANAFSVIKGAELALEPANQMSSIDVRPRLCSVMLTQRLQLLTWDYLGGILRQSRAGNRTVTELLVRDSDSQDLEVSPR